MKIQEKPDYLIFAESAKKGEVSDFPDVSRGWGVTIEQTGSKPPLEWMNGAFNRVDKNMLYLLQQGVPEWSESVKYPANAIIKYNGVLYTAIVENDNAKPATSTTKWKKTQAEVSKASTTQSGIVKLSSATNSTSETEAATPKAVKAAYDLASNAVKKSGDEITGQLRFSPTSYGMKFLHENGNELVMRPSGDSFIYAYYDAKSNTWTNKLRYAANGNTWRFENVDDVAINGKSVLTRGDYGIGSSTGAIANNFDDHLAGGFYQCRTTDFSDLQLAGNSAATLLAYPSTTATWKIEQLSVVNSKEPRIYYRCDTKEGKQKWHEAITTANINDYLPVGIPQPWPTTTPPAGWLKCNGWKFDKNKYPKLANAYPSGRLPELRAEFIRGLDDGRGVDPGREILSHQDCAIQSHNHSTPIRMFAEQGADNPWGSGGDKYEGDYIFNSNYTGDNETRPRSVAFLFIVKAE